MERDDEVSGSGNSYTTEFRQYDPRLGRWKSIDPLFSSFPWQSPYVAFDNNPIYYVDPHGLSAGPPPAEEIDDPGVNVQEHPDNPNREDIFTANSINYHRGDELPQEQEGSFVERQTSVRYGSNPTIYETTRETKWQYNEDRTELVVTTSVTTKSFSFGTKGKYNSEIVSDQFKSQTTVQTTTAKFKVTTATQLNMFSDNQQIESLRQIAKNSSTSNPNGMIQFSNFHQNRIQNEISNIRGSVGRVMEAKLMEQGMKNIEQDLEEMRNLENILNSIK